MSEHYLYLIQLKACHFHHSNNKKKVDGLIWLNMFILMIKNIYVINVINKFFFVLLRSDFVMYLGTEIFDICFNKKK